MKTFHRPERTFKNYRKRYSNYRRIFLRFRKTFLTSFSFRTIRTTRTLIVTPMVSGDATTGSPNL
ncbi:MAG: hypothetical protein N3G77_00025 [Nitrososphaeria archaeon]|nr:hypothetical protein [Nitrososphaeria archaeon]MDW7986205.1 hypothetical protein [Nitrososphaerota archaeon]